MSYDLDREMLHAQIDANLRKAYQQSLNEKLPKRFIDLIDKLRAGEAPELSHEGSSEAESQ